LPAVAIVGAMANEIRQNDLFPSLPPPPDTAIVNDRCLIRTQDNHRVVLGAGTILAQYAVSDRMAEAYTIVNLVEQGWADQNDVARAFGCDPRTVRRHQHRFDEGGLEALGRSGGCPTGSRRSNSRARLIHRLKTEGHSNREIARRIGISEMAVRKRLRQMGWKDLKPQQRLLPLGVPANQNLSASQTPGDRIATEDPPPSANQNLSAFSSASEEEPLPFTSDRDPANRVGDRIMAYLGFLDDAAPLFRPGTRVPGAGVLLALPALIQGGVFECARKIYGSIGPAFYGLRTSILALLLMALLRIKRPEGLKEHPPDDLGRVLGLDRAPEVKTLRRKLTRLAAFGRAVEFGRTLAERRVTLRGTAMGFLYVDGHVRVYHGKHQLPKAHVARMRLSMPATSDYL